MSCSLGRSVQEHPRGVKELSRAMKHLGWERCRWDLEFGVAVGRAGWWVGRQLAGSLQLQFGVRTRCAWAWPVPKSSLGKAATLSAAALLREAGAEPGALYLSCCPWFLVNCFGSGLWNCSPNCRSVPGAAGPRVGSWGGAAVGWCVQLPALHRSADHGAKRRRFTWQHLQDLCE